MAFKERTAPDWDKAAQKLLDIAKADKPYTKGEFVVLSWRESKFIGTIHYPYLDHLEIVMVIKTSNPVQEELVAAIRKRDPDVRTVTVDKELDFTGPKHILREVECRLTRMTTQQTKYAMENPIINIDL